VIAATVAGIPNSLGGIRMAISVAELARAGIRTLNCPLMLRSLAGTAISFTSADYKSQLTSVSDFQGGSSIFTTLTAA
jgi:hypothetical protein